MPDLPEEIMNDAKSWPDIRRATRGPVAKRGCDLLLAALLLLPVAIVIGLLCLLVRRDGGPAFFGHRRVGRDSRLFLCWKIRTMVPDAETVLQRHLADTPEAAAEWDRDRKLDADPRITPLGRFLRKTSLDELPQLWNVLRGDMSFVGPRPVTEPELARYRGHAWCYLALQPGITGLWQVSGRNDLTYDERVRLDARYLATRSLTGDLRILLRTARQLLKPNGK